MDLADLARMLMIECMRHAYIANHPLTRIEDLLKRISRPDISYLTYMSVGHAHQAHQEDGSGDHLAMSCEYLAQIQTKLLPNTGTYWNDWIIAVYRAVMDYTPNPYEDQAPISANDRLALATSVFANALSVNEKLIFALRKPLSVQEFEQFSKQTRPFAAEALTSNTFGPDMSLAPKYCFQMALSNGHLADPAIQLA